jgi:hypothetical protein
MFLRLWKRLGGKPPRGMSRLGPRSKLVLAKLGFDMRESYDDLLKEPLPERHAMLLKQLPGQHDVIELDSRRGEPGPKPGDTR